ncbi:hypothetical protein Enr13x_18820 [Stieleria neptunia]|uniref:Uncharacterized protein n=2 Tax=Stieleria neptunia TaxID=2527979 RepID=A0A518HML1_9BACT|nr:hypothetical protein Enr13x_18820 [Stieleria neptunia]
MRIKRRDSSAVTFSLRSCLGWMTISAFLIWVGAAFYLAIIAVIALQYLALAYAALLARQTGRLTNASPFVRYRTPVRELPTLRFCVVVFLGVLCLMHLSMELTFYPIAFPTIWHSPSVVSLTLAQIERLSIAGFTLLLVISFLLGAYSGDRFPRRVCVETSGALTLLHASHVMVP